MENNHETNTLQHHGIKGMKWGVRRYQNKDGSLTPAGKYRARSTDKRSKRDTNTPMKSRGRRLVEDILKERGGELFPRKRSSEDALRKMLEIIFPKIEIPRGWDEKPSTRQPWDEKPSKEPKGNI